jgi:hypothetical protein
MSAQLGWVEGRGRGERMGGGRERGREKRSVEKMTRRPSTDRESGKCVPERRRDWQTIASMG